MSLANQILRDLAAGQATAHSIALRLRITTDQVIALCEELLAEDKILKSLINNYIPVYRLNN